MKNIKSTIINYKKDIGIICNGLDIIENKLGMNSVFCSGCSHCCKQLIEITSFEYDIIKYHINGLSNDEKQKLKILVEKQCETLQKQGIFRNDDNLGSSDAKTKKKHFKLNISCPFLINDKCSIYEIRPETCWTYRQYKNNKYCKKSSQPKYCGLIYFMKQNRFKLNSQDMSFLDDYVKKQEQFRTSGKYKAYILQYAILEMLA